MQQGGSQYGVPPPPQPEMTAFGFTENGTQPQPHVLGIPDSNHFQQNQQLPVVETALLVSSRPPAAASPSNFLELVPAAGNYPDDVDALTAGEEAERGPAGNRWPREKTLALIKIRSDMDATFRDATLKGPLWEEVSRKLAEQGYTRSAKKCKEKFENVHKYYKRTKDKFGGRQDGKSYRFFAQLEALYSGSSSSAAATLPSHTTRIYQPIPLSSISPPPSVPRPAPLHPPAPMAGVSTDGLSFSSDTLSCSSSEMDREETEEGQRKRKRKSVGGSGGRNRKMMSFFEGLMQQVMERQEAMQKKFLETIEKRDQDRMIREEAWRRQEMATFNHEHQMMAHERAMSASRDASVITFLQKITGQTVQLPQPISITVVPTTQTPSPPPKQREQQSPPPPPTTTQQQKEQAPFPQPQQQRLTENSWSPTPMPSSKLFQVQEQNQGVSMSMEPASSRWPKPEVIALINLRSGLEPRYQEAGPKGPLWEEISAGMKRLGYIRSAKRCKEKWENINKYFKKVKESNKKRPEDAKTCPYFHQLDELYRKKILEGGGGYISQNKQENEPNPNIRPITILPPPPPATPPSQVVHSGNKSEDGGPSDDGTGVSNILTKTSCNGGDQTSSFEERNGGNGEIKKSRNNTEMDVDEDIDDIVDDEEENEDEDDEEDEEEQKMAYKIEFQRQNVSGNANNGANPSVATTSSSFLAMVQ